MSLTRSFLFLAVAASLLGAPAQERSLDREVLAMGTRLAIHLKGPSPALLQDASEGILAEIARIEAACSTWREDSAWSRVNAAHGMAMPLAPEWLDLLDQAKAWNRRTGGAFDPVLMALLRAWGTRTGGTIPGPEALREAHRASGCGLLAVDREAGTVRLADPDAGLEEGGFLKGYALDAARRVALARGVRAGCLDFGGQILAWGRTWATAVAGADDRSTPRLRLGLPSSRSLASSGCSEHGRHIVDPRSGERCPDWGTVTVVANSGLEADILSTALYVLGPRDGLAWARRTGTAAAFLPHGGKVLATPAFQALRPVEVKP